MLPGQKNAPVPQPETNEGRNVAQEPWRFSISRPRRRQGHQQDQAAGWTHSMQNPIGLDLKSPADKRKQYSLGFIQLERSAVTSEYNVQASKISDVRTSKNTWLEDSYDPFVTMLTRQVGRITGMSMEYAEKFQVNEQNGRKFEISRKIHNPMNIFSRLPIMEWAGTSWATLTRCTSAKNRTRFVWLAV